MNQFKTSMAMILDKCWSLNHHSYFNHHSWLLNILNHHVFTLQPPFLMAIIPKKTHGCFNPPKSRRSATALSRQMAWAELHLPLDLSTKDQMRRHVQDPKNEGHHTSAPGNEGWKSWLGWIFRFTDHQIYRAGKSRMKFWGWKKRDLWHS